MYRVFLSAAMVVAAVSAVGYGATVAFFNDAETSSGNTFIAGAIDLQIVNDTYYNGQYISQLSFLQRDLETGDLFYSFDDVKPGDWGENTISLEVQDNDSWLCMDVAVSSSSENGITEAEDGDLTPDVGELAGRINFIYWADDGDNVLETDEQITAASSASTTVTLADSLNNIWGNTPTPFTANNTEHLGMGWCFGSTTLDAVPQDGLSDGSVNNPTIDPGFVCDGSNESNITQTDSLLLDLSFETVQARNNEGFVCERSVTETVDTTGPLVSNLLVSPTPVSFGQIVTYQISAQDESGVAYANLILTSPDPGNSHVSGTFPDNTSGTTFTAQIEAGTTQDFTSLGTYSWIQLEVVDEAGNIATYRPNGTVENGPFPTHQLSLDDLEIVVPVLTEDFEDGDGFTIGGGGAAYWNISTLSGTTSIPSSFLQGGSQAGNIFFGSFAKESDEAPPATMTIPLPDLSSYSNVQLVVSLAAPDGSQGTAWEITHRDSLVISSNNGVIDSFLPISGISPLRSDVYGTDLQYAFVDYSYSIHNSTDYITFAFASTGLDEVIGIDTVKIIATY